VKTPLKMYLIIYYFHYITFIGKIKWYCIYSCPHVIFHVNNLYLTNLFRETLLTVSFDLSYNISRSSNSIFTCRCSPWRLTITESFLIMKMERLLRPFHPTIRDWHLHTWARTPTTPFPYRSVCKAGLNTHNAAWAAYGEQALWRCSCLLIAA